MARLGHHRPPRAALAARRRCAGRRLAQEPPRWSTRSLFDANMLKPPEPNLASQPLDRDAPASSTPEPLSPPLGGDPISFAAATPPFKVTSFLPEDLRISWSWPHLVVFLVFGFASLLIVQIGAVLLLTANKHLTQKQLQQMIESKPQFLFATN